jgi:uncharacterized protein
MSVIVGGVTRQWLPRALGLVLTLLAAVALVGEITVSPRSRLAPGASDSGVEILAGDGVALRAEWWPEDNRRGAAVMLLHGVSDNRRGMAGHARFLREAGYAVLSMDARGHGASGGPLISYGVLERNDMVAWAEWLRAQPGVERVYGLGASMGAAILLQALPLARIDAVVAECSYSDFRAVAYHRVGQRIWLSEPAARWTLWPLLEPALVWVRLRHGVDLRAASPEAGLRGSAAPVLLIHGARDDNTPPEHSERLARARAERVEIWLPAGATHVNALSAAPEEYRRRVLEFLDRQGR